MHLPGCGPGMRRWGHTPALFACSEQQNAYQLQVCASNFSRFSTFVRHQPLACTCCQSACSIADFQAALGVRNHSTQQATAKIQQVRTYTRCQITHADLLPAVNQVRIEEACLLVYESLNLRRAFLRHFGLAQLTTPPSVLGHNLPQHHPKAVDINLHQSWQAGHAVQVCTLCVSHIVSLAGPLH